MTRRMRKGNRGDRKHDKQEGDGEKVTVDKEGGILGQ